MLLEQLENQEEAFAQSLFARGFLLAREKPKFVPPSWERIDLHGGYSLWNDPRSGHSRQESGQIDVLVLGDAFSLDVPKRGLADIVAVLANALIHSEQAFLEEVDRLHGRFALVYRSSAKSGYRVTGDATGMRAVFHPLGGKMAGSHAALVAANVGARERELRSVGYGFPGRQTPFDEVVLMVPNQQLIVETGELSRVWPRASIPSRTTEESATMAQALMRRALRGIVHRYPAPLVSLTAGTDSRATLALCLDSEVAHRLRYFTYRKVRTNEGSIIDICVANALARRFRLNHEVLELDPFRVLPPEFLEVQRHNAYYKHMRHAEAAYLCRYGGRGSVHIRSNLSEIGRAFYRKRHPRLPQVCSGAELARAYLGRAKPRASKASKKEKDAVYRHFEEFYQATDFSSAMTLCDPYDLLYWEHRMGAWHSQVVLGSDAAFQTLSLFNSRKILEALLSAPLEARIGSRNMLRLIRQACPECLDEPINEMPKPRLWPTVAQRSLRTLRRVLPRDLFQALRAEATKTEPDSRVCSALPGT